MKTVLGLINLFMLFSSVLYTQNNESPLTFIDWGISLNTGYSPYGTGISVHKNFSNNINLEASFGVDLVLIPFVGAGPASNEYLIGIGGNYFIFEKSNLAFSFASFLHVDSRTDENIIGDKRYLSVAAYFGFIPRLQKDFPFFLKLGLNTDLTNSKKLEFGFVFGLLFSL